MIVGVRNSGSFPIHFLVVLSGDLSFVLNSRVSAIVGCPQDESLLCLNSANMILATVEPGQTVLLDINRSFQEQ